jgi:hypothetical protein
MSCDRDDGDPIRASLRQLADVQPPPSLVPAVMRKIAEPRPLGFWGWLRQPRKIELRLSPLSVGALGLTLTLGAYVVAGRRPALAPPPVAATFPTGQPVLSTGPNAGASMDKDGAVLVRFVLVAKGARKVAVAGDFNGWNPDGTVLQNADGQGLFVATVPLGRGDHEYMFVVDGEWVTDPTAAEVRPDGFGRSNAVLRL